MPRSRLLAALGSALLVAAVDAAPPVSPVNRFGLSEPRLPTPASIRLATYNVLNLFDDHDDPRLSGRYDDLAMATDPARCRRLADAIRVVNADIIALQEVESMRGLRWFRDTFLPDAGYRYLASEDVGYYRGVECSVMSRLPIDRVRVWPRDSLDDVSRPGPGWAPVPPDLGRGLTFQRSPLMVEIQVTPAYRLTLLCVHHKAGRDYDYQREAEALRIVEIVSGLQAKDESRNLVILGDFNAAPWDKSMRVYFEAGFIDTLAHRVIPRGDDGSQEEARLYKTHESNQVKDYILLNSAAHRELVIGSPHVFGTLTPPPSYNWRTDPHPEGYASDHYPVILDLFPRDLK